MLLKNYYYYYPSSLPLKFCNDILELAKNKKSQEAITGQQDLDNESDKEHLEKSRKKRKSNITWLDERWIYKEIHPYIHEANKEAGWNFQWDFSENAQFTEYGSNQHYNWHADSWEEPYNFPDNLDKHGKIRKLSVTLSLSEPFTYEGGNLEFDFRNSADLDWTKKETQRTITEIRPKGSICIFPSFLWHRVTPVTKGVRHSLVLWNLGFPYK